MAQEDVIDHYINRQGIQEDTNFIVTQLKTVYDELKALQAVKFDLKGIAGTRDILNSLKALTEQQKQLEISVRTANAQLKAQADANLKNANANLAAAKAATEATRQADIAARTAERAEKQKQQAVSQSEKIAAQEKKIADEISNEYLQLSKAYNDAALKAKNYAITLGEQHPIAMQAAKDAKELGDFLKRIDASVGQYQRNVGNYSSAFQGLQLSMSQIIREAPTLAISFQMFALAVSNNLPILFDSIEKAKKANEELAASGKQTQSIWATIGRSLFSPSGLITIGVVLFTVFSKAISEWVTKLFAGKDAAEELRRKLDSLSDSATRTKNSIQNINTELDFLSQKKSLEIELQFAGDATLGNLKKAQSELDILILKNGKLQQEGKKSSGETKQALDVTLAQLSRADREYLATVKKLDVTDQFTLKFKNVTGALSALTEAEIGKLSKQGQAAVNQLKNVSQAEAEVNKEIYKNKQDIELQNIRIQNAEKQLNEERYNKSKELAAMNLAAIYDLQVLYAERELNLQKAIADAEVQDFSVEARQKQLDAELQIIELERWKEVEIGEKTSIEIEVINQKALDKRREAEATAAADIIRIRKSIEDSIKAEGEAAIKGQDDKAARDLQRRIDDEKKFTETRQGRYQRETDEELAALNKRYAAGKISKEDYEKDKLKIETSYLQKSLLEQIRYQERLVKLYEFDLDKRTEALNKLAELEKKLTEVGIKDKDKRDANDLKRLQEKKDAILRLVSELSGLTFDLFTGAIDRQKNAIQEQIDLIEKKKQKEIEAVAQSIASEQQKADQIAIIQARADAQRDQMEQRKRQLDQQRARYERASTIASIIQNTAQAVTSALTSKPPNVPLAVIVGAIGAAQIARVLAQPIPKYKTGTMNHPGGPAIVGDGGVSEMVVTPQGDIMKTPATDTIIDLPKGSKVFRDFDEMMSKMAMEQGAKIMGYNKNIEQVKGIDAGTFNKGINRLANTITNKKETHILVENKLKQWIKSGSNWQEFLNRN